MYTQLNKKYFYNWFWRQTFLDMFVWTLHNLRLIYILFMLRCFGLKGTTAFETMAVLFWVLLTDD